MQQTPSSETKPKCSLPYPQQPITTSYAANSGLKEQWHFSGT